MMTMAQVIEALTEERNLFIQAIKNLPDTTLERKGSVGEWSIKNVIAHLTSWERVVTAILPERVKTGIMPDILLKISADENVWNAQQIALYEHLSPQEQLAELHQTRIALLQVLENLGEEAIMRSHPWPQWQGTLGEYVLRALKEHDHEHRELVLDALKHIER